VSELEIGPVERLASGAGDFRRNDVSRFVIGDGAPLDRVGREARRVVHPDGDNRDGRILEGLATRISRMSLSRSCYKKAGGFREITYNHRIEITYNHRIQSDWPGKVVN
jgi:hypothetical protein